MTIQGNFIDIFKNNIIQHYDLLDINNNKKGWQSKITFYKISDECKKKFSINALLN